MGARIQGAGNEIKVWTIDGLAANSRGRFFTTLAAALAFPAYFGRNWDAVYDCLTDLACGHGPTAVVLIAGGEQFLDGMGSEWETASRVFADAAAFWQERGRLLLLVLISGTELDGVPELPAACLEQVLGPIQAGQEISQVDEEIRSLNRAGKFDDASRLARDLVARFPENPRSHFVLGGTLDFQDREAEAVPSYQRAWELGLNGDDVPRFYVQYGSTLRNVGQFEEAVRVLQEGHDRFPEDAAIQAFLALALFSGGYAAEALATSLSVLTEHASSPDLHGYDRALRAYIADLRASAETY